MLIKLYRLYVSVLILALLPISLGYSQEQLGKSEHVLYVSNFNANTITAYNATTGEFLRTAVQAGPELSGANGFAIAQDGSFFVAGQFSNNVVHYSKQGQLLGILDPSNVAGISSPQGVNFGPDGLLYVASFDNDKIVRFDVASGQFKDVFVPVKLDGVSHMGPIEPKFDSDQNLVVPNFDGHRILKYQGPGSVSPAQGTTALASTPPPGTLLKVYDLPPSVAATTSTTTSASVSYASGLSLSDCVASGACAATASPTLTSATNGATTPIAQKVFVVDAIDAMTLTGEIQEFHQDGTFVSHVIPYGVAGLALPGGIALGPDGKLYIANIKVDANFQDVGSEILRFDPVTGQFLGTLVPPGLGLNIPFAMTFGKP